MGRVVAAKRLALGGRREAGEAVLAKYETGDKQVSTTLLNKMAALYRRPLLAFYLPAPPPAAPRGEDFRTLPDDLRNESAGPLNALIRDIHIRQSLVKSLLVEIEEAEEKYFIGSLSQDVQASEAAASLAKALGFSIAEFRACKKNENAFNYLRDLTERLGVYVFLIGNLGTHHTNIPVEVFRGFALSDKIAPIVVINDLDAPSARSFTLLHELVHLFLGISGVSGARDDVKVERYCNSVASQLLLDEAELVGVQWDTNNLERLLAQVASFGKERNVSGSLVAYRLFLRDSISQELWIDISTRLRKLWYSQKAAEKQKKEDLSGPNYYVVRRHKVGNALVGLVQRSLLDGAITATKAGRVLGVKPANVYNLVGI